MTEDKILVVDDEVGMLTLLRNYLAREGYDVTTAPSAEVALPMVEEYDIAVVLTDLRRCLRDCSKVNCLGIHAVRSRVPPWPAVVSSWIRQYSNEDLVMMRIVGDTREGKLCRHFLVTEGSAEVSLNACYVRPRVPCWLSLPNHNEPRPAWFHPLW